MLSTAELCRRPSRPPNYAAENEALIALARELAASPKGILQKLADTALSLCHAHSAGLSLLEDADQKSNFHWLAIAGQWAAHVNGGTPRDFGPCGTVLDQDIAMVCSHPELDFPYWAPIKPVLEEGLLIPFYISGEAVGTIWVIAHDTSRRFDAEDLRVMTNLGTFAAAAYQAWLSVSASERLALLAHAPTRSSNRKSMLRCVSPVVARFDRSLQRNDMSGIEGKPGSLPTSRKRRS
jgi:GAF domain-containing protein